jgi:hypothetical protein
MIGLKGVSPPSAKMSQWLAQSRKAGEMARESLRQIVQDAEANGYKATLIGADEILIERKESK